MPARLVETISCASCLEEIEQSKRFELRQSKKTTLNGKSKWSALKPQYAKSISFCNSIGKRRNVCFFHLTDFYDRKRVYNSAQLIFFFIEIESGRQKVTANGGHSYVGAFVCQRKRSLRLINQMVVVRAFCIS